MSAVSSDAKGVKFGTPCPNIHHALCVISSENFNDQICKLISSRTRVYQTNQVVRHLGPRDACGE